MYGRNFLFIIFLCYLCSPYLSGQTDNILWAATQVRTSIDDNWSVQLQPIFRANNDFGSYQNTSIDYSVRRKLGRKWFAGVIGRTWLMPDRGDRQFIWFDVGYNTKIPALRLNMNNRLRLHWALDVYGNVDNDFIRYIVAFTPDTDWKVKPFLAIEPWWQFNGENAIRRIRYEPGIRWNVSSTLDFNLTLWRQNSVNAEILERNNIWVTALVIKV